MGNFKSLRVKSSQNFLGTVVWGFQETLGGKFISVVWWDFSGYEEL